MNDTYKDAKNVFYPNTVSFECGVKKITTRADNTLDLTLNTQELPEEQLAQVFRLKAQHCSCAIAPHGEEPAPFDHASIDAPKGKSPSNRLRNVLFRLWEQQPEGYKDSDQYYLVKMNSIIEHFKSKLN